VAKRPELCSDTVSAVLVPEGFDSNELAEHCYAEYDMSFGVGLGELSGKAFRIGHLGSMTDAMALCGLATIEMAMADLNYPVALGSGVAAAQDYYRRHRTLPLKEAA
jgi:alanine-glyoxylate transaminase/serine-glyoxylate transaminase/serine-pyruvate transaminase